MSTIFVPLDLVTTLFRKLLTDFPSRYIYVSPLMSKIILLLSLLFGAVLASASEKPENWLQVSSEHLTTFCDGNEKQARRVADQFERMRSVFQTVFPDMKIDPGAPIVVIAVKNAKDFRALEPEAYLAKGQLELSGLFLRAPDKNYILLRMDAGGEHPYATVYHEYTHLLLSKADDWFPLWLNEGLAEFYENTDISGKDTILGQASSNNILWLRQNALLPLATLLEVDHRSPYYHEEQKGSIFYAEAWALTHYLKVKDAQNNTNRIRDYILQVRDHVDSVAAAAHAFGDLKQLQSALGNYVEQSSFSAFKLTKVPPIDDATFKVQPVTRMQADAVRADFLAYNGREKDARVLLDQLLKDDPPNTLAHETMGHLEFQAGHLEQAQKWYDQAVKLDSQSYLANYYFAAIAMHNGPSEENMDGQIESSLQKAIKLNPSFAPSYDQLAVFYGMRRKNLDQAHMLALQAVQLDPGNVHFRMNAAFVLLAMQRETDAITVLQVALKLAKTPEDGAAVQNELEAAQRSQAMREAQEEQTRRFHDEMEAPAKPDAPEGVGSNPPLKEEILKGPHRTVTGTIKNVHCSVPAVMDLDVDAGSRTIALHAANYYKIRFTALGFIPDSELKPCTDLEGARAKVEYIESAAGKTNGMVSIELHK
jgi:tetratricopeptide (TPR) repeat protein